MNIEALNPNSLERMLAAELRQLLGSIPWLQEVKVGIHPAELNRAFDLRAQFQVPQGPQIELWVDCRLEPRPSQFPYVAMDREFEAGGKTKRVRVGVFAAPTISPRMAELCESHGWSWFDLAGNCRITVPGLFHLEHRGKKSVYQRQKPGANLGSRESARVIRALLTVFDRGEWTQRSLESVCSPKVSLGLVNKVVRHLRDEALIEAAPNGGFCLQDPLKLLLAWREAYRFDRHERRSYFTFLQGQQLREALARLGRDAGKYAIYAAFSAAEFQAPHVRQPKTWLYISEPEISCFEKLLEAKAVESGGNLEILIPDDEGVFSMCDGGGIGEKRLACTNPVQTYVDLWHCGGRGKEAAEALLEQRLKPEWKRRGLLA